MDRVKCKQCHSVYQLSSRTLEHKEVNTIECFVCGLTIKHWNGFTTYTARLTRRGRGASRFLKPA